MAKLALIITTAIITLLIFDLAESESNFSKLQTAALRVAKRLCGLKENRHKHWCKLYLAIRQKLVKEYGDGSAENTGTDGKNTESERKSGDSADPRKTGSSGENSVERDGGNTSNGNTGNGNTGNGNTDNGNTGNGNSNSGSKASFFGNIGLSG